MLRRLLRFGLVGGLATAFNFLVFAGLAHAGVHYLVAGVIGWALSLGLSYLGNKRFTFGHGRGVDLRELAVFASGYGVQLGLGLTVYAVLIDGLGMRPEPAFLINLVVVAAFSFTFMSRAVFRARMAGVAGTP